MNLKMGSVAHLPSTVPLFYVSKLHRNPLISWKSQNPFRRINLPCRTVSHSPVCYSNTPQWEPVPTTYAPEKGETLLTETGNIFETMTSSEPSTKQQASPHKPLLVQLSFLRRTLWLVGPVLLLITGVVPTLWLPVSSIFLGPNIASLLSLTGLDCIFNLGASLFLLMADSTARPTTTTTKPPSSYRFYNTVANITGFIVPLLMLFGSQRGFLQPEMPFVSFLVLLGPYLLLLSVQMLTEMLTWHWGSPVWLVTPVVYEGYRLLQLMRGLRLGAELGVPGWVLHTVRGLVCGWVVVLGVQVMRVAWYAGFTAGAYRKQQSDASAADG